MRRIYKIKPEVIYLEWFNNWLTMDKMAEYYGCSPSYMLSKVSEGKEIYNQNN